MLTLIALLLLLERETRPPPLTDEEWLKMQW